MMQRAAGSTGEPCDRIGSAQDAIAYSLAEWCLGLRMGRGLIVLAQRCRQQFSLVLRYRIRRCGEQVIIEPFEISQQIEPPRARSHRLGLAGADLGKMRLGFGRRAGWSRASLPVAWSTCTGALCDARRKCWHHADRPSPLVRSIVGHAGADPDRRADVPSRPGEASRSRRSKQRNSPPRNCSARSR